MLIVPPRYESEAPIDCDICEGSPLATIDLSCAHNDILVVDAEGLLVGALNINDLLRAKVI